MKKIFYYFLTSAVFALIFNAAGKLNQQSMLNSENGGLENLQVGGFDLGSLGLSSLGFGNLNLGNLGLGDFSNVTGTCSGDKPLMLTTGECVSCDFVIKSKQNVDVLMGCEQCPNLNKKGINCLMAVDTDSVTQKDTKKSGKQVKTPEKPVFTHKYRLINIMGGDKLRVTLEEVSSGQKKIISVGDTLEDGTVKTISLDEGIIVEKNGVLKLLDIGI